MGSICIIASYFMDANLLCSHLSLFYFYKTWKASFAFFISFLYLSYKSFTILFILASSWRNNWHCWLNYAFSCRRTSIWQRYLSIFSSYCFLINSISYYPIFLTSSNCFWFLSENSDLLYSIICIYFVIYRSRYLHLSISFSCSYILFLTSSSYFSSSSP